MPYDTARRGTGWAVRCQECGEWTEAATLAPMAGWMARHTCPPRPRKDTS